MRNILSAIELKLMMYWYCVLYLVSKYCMNYYCNYLIWLPETITSFPGVSNFGKQSIISFQYGTELFFFITLGFAFFFPHKSFLVIHFWSHLMTKYLKIYWLQHVSLCHLSALKPVLHITVFEIFSNTLKLKFTEIILFLIECSYIEKIFDFLELIGGVDFIC